MQIFNVFFSAVWWVIMVPFKRLWNVLKQKYIEQLPYSDNLLRPYAMQFLF